MKRKGFSIKEFLMTSFMVSAVLVLGVSAVGCGQQAEEVTTTDPIVIWAPNTLRTETIESLGGQFNSSKAINAVVEIIDSSVYEEKSIDKIAADDRPDIWIVPNDWIQDHKDKAIWVPANFIKSEETGGPKNTAEYFAKFLPFVQEDLLVNGSAIGSPGPVQTLVLYKNRNLFATALSTWQKNNRDATDAQKAEVKRILSNKLSTWADVKEAVKLITQRDGENISTAGIALGNSTNVEHADDIFHLLTMQQGGLITDAKNRVSLFENFITLPDGSQLKPGEETLKFLKSFSNPSSELYSWNASMANSREAFKAGQVAMIIDYPEFEEEIKQDNKRVSFDVVAVPQQYAESDPVNYAEYYVVLTTKATVNPAVTTNYALAITQKSNTTIFTKAINDSVSPFISVIENSGDEVKNQALTAKTVYKRKHNQFDVIIKDMINNVTVKGQNELQSLNNAADQITKLLQSED